EPSTVRRLVDEADRAADFVAFLKVASLAVARNGVRRREARHRERLLRQLAHRLGDIALIRRGSRVTARRAATGKEYERGDLPREHRGPPTMGETKSNATSIPSCAASAGRCAGSAAFRDFEGE